MPKSENGDIYAHLVRQPTPKIFFLAVVTGMVQALLLISVALDYQSRWSSRWLALAAGTMVSTNSQLLLALALCKVVSLASLTYYVHSEAQAAVALMLEVTGRRPACPAATVARLHRNPFLALVPFWQLLLAIGTFGLQSFIFASYYLPAGYGSQTINQDSALITDVIFAAVALSFVLELDNKAYELLQTTPESYSMASMYSAVITGNRTAEFLLPMASSTADISLSRRCQVWLLSLRVSCGVVIEGLYKTWFSEAIWSFEICCFHALIMMYTSLLLVFSATYVLDVYPGLAPGPGDAFSMIVVALVAGTFFIMFQLVLGVWLPPPEAAISACEETCSKSGRGFNPAQCHVCRSYALAGNIIIPFITAVVSLVGHDRANAYGAHVLKAADISCEQIVNEQLSRTGGPNISCGNTEVVDMVQFVTNTVNSHRNVTGMDQFPICSALGVGDLSTCSSIWFLGVPVAAWIISCVVLVIIPLLIISKRQQPCRGCAAAGGGPLPTVCELQAQAGCNGAEKSLVSVFAAKYVDALDGRKSV